MLFVDCVSINKLYAGRCIDDCQYNYGLDCFVCLIVFCHFIKLRMLLLKLTVA